MVIYDVRKVANLRELLDSSVKLFGEKPAFQVKDRKISYAEFADDVRKLGNKLLATCDRSKPIALIGANSYNWCKSYLAIANSGFVCVPIDRELPAEDVKNILLASEASVIIGQKKYLEACEGVKQLDIDQLDDETEYENAYDSVVIDNEKLGFLLFTSGTTGASKGVMLSHKNIASNIMSVSMTVKISPEDTVLSVCSIHHVYECTLGFLNILYGGGKITFCDGLKYIAKNMLEYRPTLMLVVPLLLENIHKKIIKNATKTPADALKFKAAMLASNMMPQNTKRQTFKAIHDVFGGRLGRFIVGAAAMDPSVSRDFEGFGIKVLQGYGLTECSPLVTGNNDKVHYPDSIGCAIPNVKVRLDNVNDQGVGEICAQGDNVMLGYFKNPELTAKVLKNGWFHTGDLATVDRNGFYRIVGRCKDVIVTKNGKNIYPEELVYHLNKSEFIAEVVVVGVQKDGDTVVTAVVFPDFEQIAAKLKIKTATTAEAKDIIEGVVRNFNKNMPLYKRIGNTILRDKEFEKTTTKKIKSVQVL